MMVFRVELFLVLFCKILLQLSSQFANCNLETGMASHSTFQHFCITSWVFCPQHYWSILKTETTKYFHKRAIYFPLLFCSCRQCHMTGILGNVQTAITQDWLATGWSKFCVLKKDVRFIARLLSRQNSFRSGRNTADRWCWRTVGLDPCETFSLSWHTEGEAHSYAIIITLSTKQTWLRGEDTERRHFQADRCSERS